MDAPFTILDIALFFIVIISGLLAMTRGFLREFFSIVSWAAAVIAVVVLYFPLEAKAMDLITNDTVAKIALAATLFLGTLIAVSIVSYIITDKILDSKIGALDRTLGFIFGAVRGFLLVVACYLLLLLFESDERKHFDEITGARSIGLIKDSSDILLDALPDKPGNFVSDFLGKIKNARRDNSQSVQIQSPAITDQPDTGILDDATNALPE
ncbi:MAG: CvpA family protein [Rhizobiales bacterium]|nr:CvpA family protein [Hyphomicrobiales bacterium]NRB13009.1 CvpA family protein [Hyphomicrobiales bacterium]